MSVADHVLGVDGGGTTTIAWLASREGRDGFEVFGHGQSGPSNLRVAGFDVASRNVDQAIQQAFQSAGMQQCQVQSLCLAMAGSDRQAERKQWRSWAESHQLASEKLVVTNDAVPVIFAANPKGQGIALIAGTGSLALGRIAGGNIARDDGNTARAGGWGPLIGDEGSGYAIALGALRAAAKAADGRGEKTELLPRFCQALEVNDPSQIISAIYSDTYDRSKIASLASIVFDAADDQVAANIIHQAALELALMAHAATDQLGLDTQASVLAITGGVALNQPAFVEQIVAHLRDRSVVFAKTSLEKFPVAGAVQMAISALQS
ncbi:N-acetylglucosamine kinase [Planctomycetes bacterium K23_9]|uniref:Glucosamine kinase GspK n=1 Tax=Stieleria marina TaxID=1930275 RepID=A0A517NNA0_9BACT|nr:Glucosamine kinase GspK [Planctomycetes bacterium K23_9]